MLLFLDAPTVALLVGLLTIFFNVISVAANVTSAFYFKIREGELAMRLKEKEVAINSLKLKEERRIDLYEDLFDHMNKLVLWVPFEDKDDLIRLVKEFEIKVNSKKLYIDANGLSIINGFTDYCKGLITTPTDKNIKSEDEFMSRFIENFNS